MANRNEQFLSVIDSATKNAILESIAVHYGKTTQEIFAEVVGADAEHLLDYMVEPMRSATSVVMQRRGF
ncbi:hypothetical protein [Pseudomonas sp. UMAB-40]|uniref:hypothetical protein n=1 Tax=Pseudomonas sp. UMAB-40 TaxID=1365407 RepID=UPI001C599443|nr:hypothetical protein [Pseudomonas sp. UMAB-40]